MKVVVVTGSPHPNGPCNTLCQELITVAKQPRQQAAPYDINALSIRGCQACRTCKEQDVDCILQDGLAPYWKDLHECGALVVSAPNYCSQVCGPMITYMNRHYCLIRGDGKLRIHPGIKLIGIFSQGREDTQAYLPQYEWFLGDFENRKMVRTGLLIHSARGSQEDYDALKKQAYQLGRSL